MAVNLLDALTGAQDPGANLQDEWGQFLQAPSDMQMVDPIKDMWDAGAIPDEPVDADKIPMGQNAFDVPDIFGQQFGGFGQGFGGPQGNAGFQLGPGERFAQMADGQRVIVMPDGRGGFRIRGMQGPGGGGIFAGGIMTPASLGSRAGNNLGAQLGLFGFGGNNPAQDIVDQTQQVIDEEMNRRWLTEQRRKDRLLKMEIAKLFSDAFKGGVQGGAADITSPEGFYNVHGGQAATTKGAFATDIPRGLPRLDVGKIARAGVGAEIIPKGLPIRGAEQGILARVLGQGIQGGQDVAMNKLGQEVAQAQAAEAANQLGAESQQGVALGGWIQDIRDAIARAEVEQTDISRRTQRENQEALAALLGPLLESDKAQQLTG